MATWGLGAVLILGTACEGRPRSPAVWVEIPANIPVSAVADTLVAHGIIKSSAEFEQMAMTNRRYRDIKPGMYLLRPGGSSWPVLTQLLRGTARVVKVVVHERMTLSEVADAVEQATKLPKDSFLAGARDPDLRARVRAGARAQTVEGYLYPTTYFVAVPAQPAVVLRQMTDTFAARWSPAWDARLDSLAITREELVTLASIIAGEMPKDEDIGRVSAVYNNRLSKGMRLQADPTVVYALGERRRLTNQDYRITSEYNTYSMRGLPPSPICQPSTATLQAALYPSDSKDLFFVGRTDGRHEFSRTYREHLQTIAKLRAPKKVVVKRSPRPAGADSGKVVRESLRPLQPADSTTR
jgi:UPF0755 protein